jgi:DNA-directed RNA polymerase subunit RPC12/RpoP
MPIMTPLYLNTLFNDIEPDTTTTDDSETQDTKRITSTPRVRAFIKKNPGYNRLYYDKNILKYRQQVQCDMCGGRFLYSTKGRHISTKKHIKALNNSPQIDRSGEPGRDADISSSL